jgi:hypothetical protein
MSAAARPSVLARGAGATLAGITALLSALSVAICAAAPELVWQGLLLISRQITRVDLLSALLIGLVLAFLVDPLMEHVRHLLSRQRLNEAGVNTQRNPLFATCIGIAFAFVSVCLHNALSSFVSGSGSHAASDFTMLEAAIKLTAAWAFVPFFVALAWIGARCWWARIPLGVIAAASPLFAGWAFSWAWQTMLITFVPCLAILLLGYRLSLVAPRQLGFVPCVRSVALVAPAWLLAIVLIDCVLYAFSVDPFGVRGFLDFWTDARFYLGWALGLSLTPFPFDPDRAAGSGLSVAHILRAGE